MKTLFLLRHAKSSWDVAGVNDIDRPLNPRGRRAAAKIAEHLRSREPPALVLCSSARRTRETLDGVAASLGETTEQLVEDALYAASAGELLDRVRRVGDDVPSVMLIAHNPGIQDLATGLAGRGRGLERLVDGFPTAALAILECPVAGWAEVAAGCATLVDFVVPRDL